MIFLNVELFGSKHIIGLIAVIIFSIILSLILDKRRKLSDYSVLIIFLITFYLLEIFKIGYIMYPSSTYPLYQLPLHLCSTPLYLYPLIVFFYKSNFVQRYVMPTAFSVVLLAGILALAIPTNIIGSQETWFPLKDNILPIISFVYHGLMIFSAIFLLKQRIYRFDTKDIFNVMVLSLAFTIVVMFVNDVLDKDFMLLNKGTGSPLAFILEQSKPLYIISMILSFTLLIFLVFQITSLFIKKDVKNPAVQKIKS